MAFKKENRIFEQTADDEETTKSGGERIIPRQKKKQEEAIPKDGIRGDSHFAENFSNLPYRRDENLSHNKSIGPAAYERVEFSDGMVGEHSFRRSEGRTIATSEERRFEGEKEDTLQSNARKIYDEPKSIEISEADPASNRREKQITNLQKKKKEEADTGEKQAFGSGTVGEGQVGAYSDASELIENRDNKGNSKRAFSTEKRESFFIDEQRIFEFERSDFTAADPEEVFLGGRGPDKSAAEEDLNRNQDNNNFQSAQKIQKKKVMRSKQKGGASTYAAAESPETFQQRYRSPGGSFRHRQREFHLSDTGDSEKSYETNSEDEIQTFGYEYRNRSNSVKKSKRSFSGGAASDAVYGSGEFTAKEGDISHGKKRKFFLADSPAADEINRTAQDAKESLSDMSGTYFQLIQKPFEAGKRTFEAGKQVFSKNYDTAKELSSGKQDVDQMMQSKSTGMIKSMMMKAAREAAMLPIRIMKGVINIAITVAAAISTGGLSIVIGIIAVILAVIVFIVCIFFAAIGILWIGQRQGYIQVSDFPSLSDFLGIYNWLVTLFHLMGDILF